RGESTGTVSTDDDHVSMAEGFRRVRAIRSLQRTWWAAFFFGAGVASFASLVSLYLKDVFHEGPAARGVVTGVGGVIGLAGFVIAERMSRRGLSSDRPEHLPVVNGLMVLQFAITMGLMGVSPWEPLAIAIGIGGAIEITAKRFVRRDVAEALKGEQAASSDALLACLGLDVAYGQVQILFDVDLEVREGEIVALLGTNGAGKSTLLKAISGIVDPIGGAIFFQGRDITHADPSIKSEIGIIQVPGGRGIFPSLTVGENLRAAGWMYRGDAEYRKASLDRVLDYFPILRERWDTTSGSLSGGEQQM